MLGAQRPTKPSDASANERRRCSATEKMRHAPRRRARSRVMFFAARWRSTSSSRLSFLLLLAFVAPIAAADSFATLPYEASTSAGGGGSPSIRFYEKLIDEQRIANVSGR